MIFFTITFFLLLFSYLIVFQTSISISLLRNQVFQPYSQKSTLPSGVLSNLSDPHLYGLPKTDVLKIPSGSGYLGAWYIRPNTSQVPSIGTVLYLHGRSQNRGYSHRVELYKELTKMGLSVLTIDYRGFGDSSDIEIHEETVVEDAKNALKYLSTNYKTKKIIIWGHSLGAPIATHMASQEEEEDDTELYLVLESSFDNMEHLVEQWDDSAWGKLAIQLTGLERADLTFRCDKYLPSVSYPVLILHTEEDRKIDLELSRNLFQTARLAGKEQIGMVTLGKELGLGHTGIYQFDGLSSLLRMLLSNSGLSNGQAVCRRLNIQQCHFI